MAISQQRQDPSKIVGQLGQDYATQLTGLTSVPLDTSKFAPTVAGQDPLQTQAASLAEFDRQAAMRQQGISDQAVALGGYGGGREGVQLAEYQTQSDRNRALLQAQMQQQGFGQGAALRQQDYSNLLGLGGAQAGLAQGQMGLGAYQQGLAQLAPQLAGGDIQTLSGVGGIQQQQTQNVLNAQRQANQMAAMEPYQRLGTYGQGIGQLAPMMGSTTTQITPDPTALQTALGWTSVLGGIMNPGLGLPRQT